MKSVTLFVSIVLCWITRNNRGREQVVAVAIVLYHEKDLVAFMIWLINTEKLSIKIITNWKKKIIEIINNNRCFLIAKKSAPQHVLSLAAIWQLFVGQALYGQASAAHPSCLWITNFTKDSNFTNVIFRDIAGVSMGLHDHAMNHDDVLEQEFTWMVLIAVERFFPADQ